MRWTKRNPVIPGPTSTRIYFGAWLCDMMTCPMFSLAIQTRQRSPLLFGNLKRVFCRPAVAIVILCIIQQDAIAKTMESVRERLRLISEKVLVCRRVSRETSCFASCFRITSPASIASWACQSEPSSPLQMWPSSTVRCFTSPAALRRRVQPCTR